MRLSCRTRRSRIECLTASCSQSTVVKLSVRVLTPRQRSDSCECLDAAAARKGLGGLTVPAPYPVAAFSLELG